MSSPYVPTRGGVDGLGGGGLGVVDGLWGDLDMGVVDLVRVVDG